MRGTLPGTLRGLGWRRGALVLDVVVPVENGRALAAGIPGAELRVWPGAGHFYPTDEPRADRDVARFLRAHTSGRSTPARLLARAQRLAARGLVLTD